MRPRWRLPSLLFTLALVVLVGNRGCRFVPETFTPVQTGRTLLFYVDPPIPPDDFSTWFQTPTPLMVSGFDIHPGLRFDVGGEKNFISATLTLARVEEGVASLDARDHLHVWLRNDPNAPEFSDENHSGVIQEILFKNPEYVANPLWIKVADITVDEGQAEIIVPLDIWAFFLLTRDPDWNGFFNLAVSSSPHFMSFDRLVGYDLTLEIADQSEVEELMAKIDVTTAAVRTLVAHLEANLPAALKDESDPVGIIAHVHEGWESQDEDMMFPSVVVNAIGMGERTGNAPIVVESTFDPNPLNPNLTCRLLVASIDVSLAIDIFAESKVQRAQVSHAVEVALQVGVVSGEDSGLIRLLATDYFNLPFTYRRNGTFQHMDTADEVGGEMWRAHAEIECGAQEVANVEAVRFLDVSIDHRIGEVTRPDTMTSGEVSKVFSPS